MLGTTGPSRCSPTSFGTHHSSRRAPRKRGLPAPLRIPPRRTDARPPQPRTPARPHSRSSRTRPRLRHLASLTRQRAGNRRGRRADGRARRRRLPAGAAPLPNTAGPRSAAAKLHSSLGTHTNRATLRLQRGIPGPCRQGKNYVPTSYRNARFLSTCWRSPPPFSSERRNSIRGRREVGQPLRNRPLCLKRPSAKRIRA